MKNSAIYSMALASVLVLSLVDVEARGLGAGGGVQQQQAPHVQQQQAPASSSSKHPASSNSKHPTAAPPGAVGHRCMCSHLRVAAGEPSVTGACAVASEVATAEPSVTAMCRSPQRSQQVSRPSQAQQALQQHCKTTAGV